ncbi:hypothetical protein [Aeromonas phage phiWae14]|nr:hypothetical protein [Aeromonas phage phiWae14]
MFIKKEDMKASMAVYMNMIKDGHIEGVNVKEIYTIPAMVTKAISEHVWSYGCVVEHIHFIKVPNVNFERVLTGYDVKVIAKSPKHEFKINADAKIRFFRDQKSDLYGKFFEKHLH